MLAGSALIGVLLLGLGAWMKWRRMAPKLLCYVWLLAGVSLGGSLVEMLRRAVTTAGNTTASLFGVVPSVLLGLGAMLMSLELWRGLKKNGQITPVTPWFALTLPIVAGAAGGGIIATALSWAEGVLGTVGPTVVGFFAGG